MTPLKLLLFSLYSFLSVPWLFGQTPIKNIIDLPENAPLPPAILKKYSSRHIGFSIVERIKHFERLETLNLKPHERKKALEFRVFFSSRIIEKIMKNGLLNQHQTNSSGGIKDTDLRLKREREWTELKLSTKNKKESDILPKYGYLIEEKAPFQIINKQYGFFAAVLKPGVQYRSTWTSADSLDSSLISPYSFNRLPKKMILEGGRFNMPEFQIYGAVDISDIQHFLFPDDQTNLPVVLKIKEAGIPIRLYKKVGAFMEKGYKIKNTRVVFYKGDPSKRRAFEKTFLERKRKSWEPSYSLHNPHWKPSRYIQLKKYPLLRTQLAYKYSQDKLSKLAPEIHLGFKKMKKRIPKSKQWFKVLNSLLEDSIKREKARLSTKGKKNIDQYLTKNFHHLLNEDDQFGFELRFIKFTREWHRIKNPLEKDYKSLTRKKRSFFKRLFKRK